MLTYNARIKKRDRFVEVKRFYIRTDYSTKYIDRLQIFLKKIQFWSNQITECLYNIYLNWYFNYVLAILFAQVNLQQL